MSLWKEILLYGFLSYVFIHLLVEDFIKIVRKHSGKKKKTKNGKKSTDTGSMTPNNLIKPRSSKVEHQNQRVEEGRIISDTSLDGYLALDYIAEDIDAPFVKDKIQKLRENGAIGYFPVPRDGNCYYRAVFSAIVENIIVNSQTSVISSESGNSNNNRENGFNFLVEIISSINSSADSDRNDLITALQEATNLKRWATLSQFRRDLEDSLDMAIVTACKHLLSKYILENHDQQFNGTTLASSLLYSSSYQKKTLESFCRQNILEDKVWAEGIFVDVGILPGILGARSDIFVFDENDHSKSVPIKVAYGVSSNNRPDIARISLLHNPNSGHYDILYRKNYNYYNESKNVYSDDNDSDEDENDLEPGEERVIALAITKVCGVAERCVLKYLDIFQICWNSTLRVIERVMLRYVDLLIEVVKALTAEKTLPWACSTAVLCLAIVTVMIYLISPFS